jgi:hypothetical protein
MGAVTDSVDRLADQAEQLRELLAAFETADSEPPEGLTAEETQSAFGDSEAESDPLPGRDIAGSLPATDGGAD